MYRTFCDSGHPFIRFSSGPAIYIKLSDFQWNCHYLFKDMAKSRLGFKHPVLLI